jgi:hypothetical protein
MNPMDAWNAFDHRHRAASDYHIYEVTFSDALKKDKHKRDMALGRRFPTGWTELKDGTFAASPHTSGAARGLKDKDTGKAISKDEMFKRQKRGSVEHVLAAWEAFDLRMAAPSYLEYRKRKERQGKPALSQEEWKRKLQTTGHVPAEEEEEEPKKKQRGGPRKKKDKGGPPGDPFAPRDSPEFQKFREWALKNKEKLEKAEKAKGEKAKGEKSFAEKKQEWLKNVKDPEERKRIQKMDPKEFEAMAAAVADEEEEGGEKKASWYRREVRAAMALVRYREAAQNVITFDGIKMLERAAREPFMAERHIYTVTRLAKDTYEVSTQADPERWPGKDPTKYVYKFVPFGDRTFTVQVVRNSGWGLLPLYYAVGHGDSRKGQSFFVS